MKVQPKAEQRTRYASDGCRFLPDSRKHPMAITVRFSRCLVGRRIIGFLIHLQLPDIWAASLVSGQQFGIIITMVTSMDNPKHQVFVHVNGIKYCTNDAVDLSNGSIFLPLTDSDISQREKRSVELLGDIRFRSFTLLFRFPRLSIRCKKFDEYTFDQVPFNPPSGEQSVQKCTCLYLSLSPAKRFFLLTLDTVCNEDLIGKVAKGKLFASEYNLLTYKFVFQLAIREQDQYFVHTLQCETDLITDRKLFSRILAAYNGTNNIPFLEKKGKKVVSKKAMAGKVVSKTPHAKGSRRVRKRASPVKRLTVMTSATRTDSIHCLHKL